MQAKEAKDLTKAAKDKKVKDKSDYDKLKEAEKQVIRDKLVAAAQPVIDAAIRALCDREEERYSLPKVDPIVASMDDKAIDQLMALYTTPGTGNHKFSVTNDVGLLHFDWA